MQFIGSTESRPCWLYSIIFGCRPSRSARRRRHPSARSSPSTAGGPTWCASSTTRSEFRHRIVMCKNELSLGVGAERRRRVLSAAPLRRGAVPVTSPAMTRAPASYVRRRDCRGPGGRRRPRSAHWGRRPCSSPSTAPARIRHRYDAAAMACLRAIEVSSEESMKIPWDAATRGEVLRRDQRVALAVRRRVRFPVEAPADGQ